MKITQLIGTILILISITVLAGCSKGISAPAEKIDIRGTITAVYASNDGITKVLVEGKLYEDTKYPRANVSIDGNTLIQRKGSKDYLKAADLKENMVVEVIITGPVRESDPVQCDAKSIIIINEK
jgi:hypothetical protein